MMVSCDHGMLELKWVKTSNNSCFQFKDEGSEGQNLKWIAQGLKE